jgi:hypothetical protein
MSEGIEGGYVAIARKILKSSLWMMPECDRIVALTCIIEANWQPKAVYVGGQHQTIPRGSFFTTLTKLTESANLSRSTVYRALQHLRKDGADGVPFLVIIVHREGMVIKLPKYNTYNNSDVRAANTLTEGQSDYVKRRRTRKRNADEHDIIDNHLTIEPVNQTTTQSVFKKNTDRVQLEHAKTEKKSTWDSDKEADTFDAFWMVYPRHDAEDRARLSWKRLFVAGENPELVRVIISAVKKQSCPGGILAQRQGDERRFIPYASTWLDDRRWKDGAGEGPRVVRGVEVVENKYKEIDDAPGFKTDGGSDVGPDQGSPEKDQGRTEERDDVRPERASLSDLQRATANLFDRGSSGGLLHG